MPEREAVETLVGTVFEHARRDPPVAKASSLVTDDNTPTKLLAWAWPEDSRPVTFRGRMRRLYNSWTYSYMHPILQKGRRQFQDKNHLTQEDLFEVPDDLRSALLLQQFWEHYREKKSFKAALWKVAAPSFLPAGFWEFLFVVARVSLPISLRQLLIALQENPGQAVVRQGLPYAITLSAAALLAALSQNRNVFLSTKSGIALRAALTSAIYDRALRLTPEGRAGLSAGEVTNLVAVDTQKLYEVMLEGHNIWSCPLIIIVVTVLLWVIMGPELTVGVLFLILCVPLVQFFVAKMLRIRKARSALTDKRVSILSSMLQGIHVTKVNHYESKVEALVGSVRDAEMYLLRKELQMWGWVLAVAVVSPLIATGMSFAFFVLVNDNVITAADAFSALLLFSILRFPINLTARLVGKAAQASEAARRIESFLKRDVRPDEDAKDFTEALDGSKHVVLTLRDGNFTVKPDDDAFIVVPSEDILPETMEATEEPLDTEIPDRKSLISSGFTIRNINLQVEESQVIAIIGQVGSGKTLLLRALLGELNSRSTTELDIKGRLSYAAQQPFILNASFRENILFGSDFNEERYERAVDACCLRPDVQRLGPAGDLTEIGERGVTLSGGQRQRVALARAIFIEPDVALLDDCFSALDAATARMVFDGLFRSDDAVLRSCGTLLVTHALHFLPHVDFVLVMADGSPAFFGTWSELQLSQSGNSKEIIEAIAAEKGTHVHKKHLGWALRKEGFVEEDGYIMTLENREYGVSSLRVWLEWFRNAGGWLFFLIQIFSLVLDRGFYVASDWWLAIWSDSVDEGAQVFGHNFPPQRAGRSAQAQYVSVYAVIIALSVGASILRSQWAVAGGARCADKMFKAMTHRVLRAPMSYFETTPLGRVLNRFTYDVEVLDIELSVAMIGIMISSSWLVSAIVVMAAVLPWILLGLVPVFVVYFLTQLYYRMSGPDLQRLDAMSRSPIQANVAEGLEGAATIRAFKKEDRFSKRFREAIDRNSSAMLNFLAAQRWLGLRIEVMGTAIGFTLSTIIVCANDRLGIPPGLVGLVVQWSIFFTTALNFFFLRFSESEARITSIERIQEMTQLPQEASWDTPSTVHLDEDWPSRGALEFDHVCLRYRANLPLALDSVSFKVRPGSRCGVVGRTGSGKTSLTTALFRLVEVESGQIRLDGVDLGKLGLSDLRGRPNCLRMIPQDPVLFAGTMRECLDPFSIETDEKILEALLAVNHRGARDKGKSVLSDVVEEGGMNFSVGERQLLCLARAIVEEPRVLVLDEATASVDSATDALLQTMLRTRFQNTTLLTIAHRLRTIIDYDTILVMDDGRAVEFGRPKDLLKDAKSALSRLVDSTGEENAAELRRMANSVI